MVSALDPLGLPAVTQAVSGQRADDPLYIPAIQQVRTGVQKRGLLYIGDVKMSAQETRAFLVAGGDYYLCPLSRQQISPEELRVELAAMETEKRALAAVYRTEENGQQTLLAEGFVKEVAVQAECEGQPLVWCERRLFIRSVAQAEAQQAALDERLARVEAELNQYNVHKRGKKRYTEIAPLRQRLDALLSRQQVAGLLTIELTPDTIKTPKGVCRPVIRVTFTRNTAAIQALKAQLGWRVYATNCTEAQLALPQAVMAYRAQYLAEHSFARLKGSPLSISPIYLSDAQRVKGLIHLLSLALRVLTSLEFVVRQRLAKQAALLPGLYKGNSKRSTARPTAERLLEAFDNLTLSIIDLNSQRLFHLTELSELQLHILSLLTLPYNPYQALLAYLSNSP
jgi:transposase